MSLGLGIGVGAFLFVAAWQIAPEQKSELGSSYYNWSENTPLWRKAPLLRNQKLHSKIGLLYSEDTHQLLGVILENNKVIQISCEALDGYIRRCADLGSISVYYSSEETLKQHLGTPKSETLRSETKTISYGKPGRSVRFDLKQQRVFKIKIRSERSSYEFNPFDVISSPGYESLAKQYGGRTE